MRRLLAVLAATLVLLAIGARPAAAGGPTSALLTNPDLSRATALYHSDPAYAELERLLVNGLVPLTGEPYDADIAPGAIHVTWLAHDVWVWRTDAITLGPGPDVEVCTLQTRSSGELGDVCSWQRAEDPAAVRAALADLGMVPGSTAPPSRPSLAPTTAPVPGPAEQPAERTAAASLAGNGGIGWVWAVGGALVGVLAGLAIRTGRRRGPVAQLVDRTESAE